MKHIMVDIETLGTSPGCAILSIGAAEFDPSTEKIGGTFYSSINLQSSLDAGFAVDADTIKWWISQGQEASASAFAGALSVHEALRAFNSFVGRENTYVWSNGADFDIPILISALDRLGIEPGWKFYNNRCFRTLKNLHRNVKPGPRVGVHHHALDDAVFQAEHAIAILRSINA